MAFILGSAISANQQSQAAKGILNAQTQATQDTIAESRRQYDLSSAEQKRQYDLGRADQMPWLNTGKGALGILGSQYGIGADGSTGNAPVNSFQASPDYQFRQDEQMRALNARNSALGIQDSGSAQKSALQLSGNLASGEYGNWYNRLAGLAGVGQTAANTTGAAGQNYANAVGTLGQNYSNAYGNAVQKQGQNLASSYQNRADANSGAIGNALGYLTGIAKLAAF